MRRPKTGGRKPGVPNRRTLDLADALDRLGYDLVAETMKNLARIDDPYKAAQVQMRMWNFIYPTRGPAGGALEVAAVDVTPEGEKAEELSVEELQAIALAPVKDVV